MSDLPRETDAGGLTRCDRRVASGSWVGSAKLSCVLYSSFQLKGIRYTQAFVTAKDFLHRPGRIRWRLRPLRTATAYSLPGLRSGRAGATGCCERRIEPIHKNEGNSEQPGESGPTLPTSIDFMGFCRTTMDHGCTDFTRQQQVNLSFKHLSKVLEGWQGSSHSVFFSHLCEFMAKKS